MLSRNVKVKIYKTIILPLVLYGYETWSLTFREEHRLRVFENRVLKRIFGPKREEVTRERRKLHNGKIHNLYSPPDIRQIKSRRMRWAGHGRNVYRILVGKPEGKRSLERPRRRREDGIRMDLREIGLGGAECIHFAEVAGPGELGDEPPGSGATNLVNMGSAQIVDLTNNKLGTGHQTKTAFIRSTLEIHADLTYIICNEFLFAILVDVRNEFTENTLNPFHATHETLAHKLYFMFI
jgi:hypothetical protein